MAKSKGYPMSLLSHVELAPADPILGLTEKFNADTRMENVDLSGADLSRAKMEKFQAKNVIYDGKTQFPDGFEPAKFGLHKKGQKVSKKK